MICGLSSAKEPVMEIKAKWINDIKFFKANCFKDLEKIDVNDMNGGGDPLLDLKQDELDEAKAAAANSAKEPGRVVD